MNNKIIAIGELLIDFTATSTGTLLSVSSFEKNPGGAPANVAVCVKRLGGESAFITKLGADSFGDFLYKTIEIEGVDVSLVYRDHNHHTPMAFVALDNNGERDFVFLREHSSDLFLTSDEIIADYFVRGDILHLGSVDLVRDPVKSAHVRAIDLARENEMIISFDPNLRPPLWPNKETMLMTVRNFIPRAHIIKISVEELFAITDCSNENEAISRMFQGNVMLVLVTRGKDGSSIYSKTQQLHASSESIKVIDATGAGDAFVGAFLFSIMKLNKTINNLCENFNEYQSVLDFCNRVAAFVCQRRGAIPAMPRLHEIK
jgi:fructokinase